MRLLLLFLRYWNFTWLIKENILKNTGCRQSTKVPTHGRTSTNSWKLICRESENLYIWNISLILKQPRTNKTLLHFFKFKITCDEVYILVKLEAGGFLITHNKLPQLFRIERGLIFQNNYSRNNKAQCPLSINRNIVSDFWK